MRHDRLDGLVAIVAVAETNGFSAAAAWHGVSEFERKKPYAHRTREEQTAAMDHATSLPAAVRATLSGFAVLLLCLAPVRAADAPMLYDIVIETSMPHLDENLRYATRREQACLDTSDLSQVFPALHDVSLQDCELVKGAEDDGIAVYRLQCRGGHGTSGEARWRLEPDRVAGTLNVKLGGKNMTFYQRITGRPAGACARP